MFTQKIATSLTIVSILFLIITCTINVLDFYVIDSFNPHTIHTYPPAYHLTTLVPVSWYLTFICSALILVSWCWNLIICIQLSKTKWWTWFNIIAALIIGIYVLVEIYFFVTCFPNRSFLLYLPYGIFRETINDAPIILGVYAIWLIQYVVSSAYVAEYYKNKKH